MQQKTRKHSGKRRAALAWKALALLALLCVVPAVNYAVDPSRIYHQSREDSFEIEAVGYLLEGRNVANLSNFNERLLRREYLLQIEQAPPVLVAGSSRGELVTTEMLGLSQGEMFNISVSGGCLEDTVGFLGLLWSRGLRPQRLILCLDPWTVNDRHSESRYRTALGDGYYAFVHDRLGREADESMKNLQGIYDPDSDFSFWTLSRDEQLNLFSVSYFQSALQWYFSPNYPLYRAIAPTEAQTGVTGIVRADGSYAYPDSYTEADAETACERARETIPQIIGLDDYPVLKGEKYELLCATLEALAEDGVAVQLVLCPISNYLYDYMVEHRGEYANFFHTEQMYYDLAAAYDLPITGTFNPYTLRYDMSDFYDGYHLRSERVAEIIGGLG